MNSSKIVALAIVGIMVASGLAFLVPTHKDSPVPAHAQTSTYPLSDYVSLWVRKNGSNPAAPFGGANVAPSVGMDYFGTQTIQVSTVADYSFVDLANEALFPAGCKIYVGLAGNGAAAATDIADAALTNPKIMGAWMDDFPTSLESHANMSAIYTATHHNDIALGRTLTLGIVVYQMSYFDQTPNTWASIINDFDIIHFWFWPDTYASPFQDMAGYEDAIRDFHEMLPTKEIWLGIYLHFYDAGPDNNSFPYGLTYEQMAIACRLIREGLVTHLSILENFWIQHNVKTSAIVRDFLNDQFIKDYSTTYNVATGVVTSYEGSTLLTLHLIEGEATFAANNYTFTSNVLQNITVAGMTGNSIRVWNLKTGEIYSTVAVAGGKEFVAEPGTKYRVLSMPLTNLAYPNPVNINSATSWNNRNVYINDTATLFSSLWVNNSIVHFGPQAPYVKSRHNNTPPANGFTINNSANAKLYIKNSSWEPTLRNFPYFIETNFVTGSSVRILSIVNSTISCYAGLLRPVAYSYFYDSTFYDAEFDGGSWRGIWMSFQGMNEVFIKRNLIYSGMTQGNIGIFVQPLNSIGQGTFRFYDNVLAGGEYGIYVDTNWMPGTLQRNLLFPVSDGINFAYHPAKCDSTTDGNAITITHPFRVDSNAALTGTLTDANGATIGTYATNTNYSIASLLLGATITDLAPYPWTFSIGTALGYGHHIYITDTALYFNTSIDGIAPRSLGSDTTTFSITAGMNLDIYITDIDLYGVSSETTSLLYLVPFFLTLGVLMIPVNYIVKQTKTKKPIQVQEVIRMFIMIVVGLTLVGITYVMI